MLDIKGQFIVRWFTCTGRTVDNKQRTYGDKHFASVDYQIFLPMTLRWLGLAARSSAISKSKVSIFSFTVGKNSSPRA